MQKSPDAVTNYNTSKRSEGFKITWALSWHHHWEQQVLCENYWLYKLETMRLTNKHAQYRVGLVFNICLRCWLVVEVLLPCTISCYIRIGTNLWLRTHNDFIVLPYCDTKLTTTWSDIPHSRIIVTLSQPHIILTLNQPCIILPLSKPHIILILSQPVIALS